MRVRNVLLLIVPAVSLLTVAQAQQAHQGQAPAAGSGQKPDHGAHMEHRFDDPERYARSASEIGSVKIHV